MWLVPRSARINVVGVELKGSKCNLKNLECRNWEAACSCSLRYRCIWFVVAVDVRVVYTRQNVAVSGGFLFRFPRTGLWPANHKTVQETARTTPKYTQSTSYEELQNNFKNTCFVLSDTIALTRVCIQFTDFALEVKRVQPDLLRISDVTSNKKVWARAFFD